jgi:tetratricopeptide (TPR) repeat protein
MDPMGQGDFHLGIPPARRRLPPLRAAALLAALGAIAAIAGRDATPTEPAEKLPQLPYCWQGSLNSGGPNAWASSEPWLAPPRSTFQNSSADAPSVAAQPYAVPATPSVIASRATATTAPEDFAPLPSVQSNDGDQPLAATPVATPHSVAVSNAPASASLLAPQPAPANIPAPAPGDVVVVEAMPTLTPPTPEAISQVAQPLHFPAEATPQPTILSVPPSTGIAAVAPAVAAPARSSAPREQLTPTPNQSAGAPTGLIVNERATERIRRGYELAERGAYFAARNEFIEVLHMIAEAKDQLHGTPRRTIALADGLRALDEAADFGPLAASTGADLSLSVIVSSHRTPAAKELPVDDMLPQQVADAYFDYAQSQLAAAVAGEPAGSMALHALGKLHSRLGLAEPEKNPQADRLAFAMQQAALLARPDNHMAAHELGVLLAESGHYAESDQLLRQVAARAPHAVVYRNLARVERQLGRPDLAAASDQQANDLAARGVDGNPNVQWVSADALARSPDALGPGSAPPMMAAAPPARQSAPAQVPMTARGPAPIQR